MTNLKRLVAGGLVAGLMAGTAYASVIDRPFFRVLGVVVVWGDTDFAENPGTAPVVSDFVLLTPNGGNAGADLMNNDDVYAVVTGTLDPISNSGTAADPTATIDPITGETSGGVFTDSGTTAGVLDASDTLTPFGIDATTDVASDLVGTHTSSFYVASNAAFDIYAQSTNVVATGDFLTDGLDDENITFGMGITTSGTDALTGGGTSISFGGTTAQDPSTGGTGVVTTIDSLDDISAGPTKVFDGGQRTAASNGTLAEQSVRFDMTYDLDSDTVTTGVQGYDLSMGVGTLQADVTYTIYVP